MFSISTRTYQATAGTSCSPHAKEGLVLQWHRCLRRLLHPLAILLNLRVMRTVSAFFAFGALCAAVSARTPTVEVAAGGLKNPWALAFIGPGQMLVTEREGSMRVVGFNRRASEPLAGLPRVEAVGQGGLLDVITDRNFPSNRMIHFCYTEPGSESGVNSTALASAKLSGDLRSLENVRVIFSQKPKSAANYHYGCRIVQAQDGSLFLTLGDRGQMKDAQALDNHHGKIVRVRLDGSPHPDNPFLNQPGALPEIWSIGHKNIQGGTLAPDGSLWVVEHGPVGGDELNRIEAGKNYGWPIISHGTEFGGRPIGAGIKAKEGMEQPVHDWTPAIAPSGLIALRGDRNGLSWKPGFLVSALSGGLVRLELDGNRVTQEERMQMPQASRARAVYEGADGHIYLLTSWAVMRVRFN